MCFPTKGNLHLGETVKPLEVLCFKEVNIIRQFHLQPGAESTRGRVAKSSCLFYNDY